MASRKVQVQIAKAYKNTTVQVCDLTVGKLKELLNDCPDDVRVISFDGYRGYYGTPHQIQFVGNGVVIITEHSDDSEAQKELFPEWVGDIINIADSNGACSEVYSIASEILAMGATEEILPESVVEKYGDSLREYLLVSDDIPEPWKAALYPGHGQELMVYFEGKSNLYYIRVGGKKIETGLWSGDFPNPGEEVEMDNLTFIFEGVLPASKDPEA